MQARIVGTRAEREEPCPSRTLTIPRGCMPSNPKSLQLKCPYKQILPEGFYLFIYLIYISAWGRASYNDLNLVKISFWIAVPMFNLKEFFFHYWGDKLLKRSQWPLPFSQNQRCVVLFEYTSRRLPWRCVWMKEACRYWGTTVCMWKRCDSHMPPSV